MKKFILNIIAFGAVIAAIDCGFGLLTDYLVENAISGSTQKNEYICDRSAEDILIFGSSRAVHHYDPRILEDSMGMTCYNCAYDGCGSITAYGLLRIISARYAPKIVVYDVMPLFDYLCGDKDNTKYLGPLKCYFDRDGIDSLFEEIASAERLKMTSRTYRINSKLIEIVSENVMRRNETVKGYLPVDRVMAYEPEIKQDSTLQEYDALKKKCLDRIVSICKANGTTLVLAASPSFRKTDDSEFEYVKQLARREGIAFINHYCDSTFTTVKDFFYDSVHMNRKGAEAYTKVFAEELKAVMGKTRGTPTR